MTTEATTARTWRVVVAEPLALVAAQPHQALISCASVALMGQFASSSEILHPLVGYALAIGVEWAYLRGLVADSKATTQWGAWLNWSAFGVVVLWGTLWCLRAFGALDERPGADAATWLALAHVLPIAWLSLCSAMSHRAMMQAEGARELAEQRATREAERRRVEAQNALQLENARKDAELERWKEAQRFKAAQQATADNQKPKGSQPFTPGSVGCQHCNRPVEFRTPSEKGVIVRLGCPACRAERKANREG